MNRMVLWWGVFLSSCFVLQHCDGSRNPSQEKDVYCPIAQVEKKSAKDLSAMDSPLLTSIYNIKFFSNPEDSVAPDLRKHSYASQQVAGGLVTGKEVKDKVEGNTWGSLLQANIRTVSLYVNEQLPANSMTDSMVQLVGLADDILSEASGGDIPKYSGSHHVASSDAGMDEDKKQQLTDEEREAELTGQFSLLTMMLVSMSCASKMANGISEQDKQMNEMIDDLFVRVKGMVLKSVKGNDDKSKTSQENVNLIFDKGQVHRSQDSSKTLLPLNELFEKHLDDSDYSELINNLRGEVREMVRRH